MIDLRIERRYKREKTMIVENCHSARRAVHVRQASQVPAVLLTAALAALVAGCASPPAGGEPRDLVCNSAQQCRVIVTVDCAAGCKATVDHPRVVARGNDIVWIIDNKPGQNYTFRTSDGIAFKTNAGRAIFSCHAEAAGNRYACMNRRTPGEYEYAVILNGAPAVPPLDPWIVN